MAQLEIKKHQAYKPPQKYLEQHNDPAFFDFEYQKYIADLQKANEDGYKEYNIPKNPQSTVQTYVSQSQEEDREENTGLYSKESV